MNKYTFPTSFSIKTLEYFNIIKQLFFRSNLFIKKILFSKKRISLFISLILTGLFSSAQSNYPYTINAAGNQIAKGNYTIEWSVGESAAVNIMDNSDRYLFTNGLLQYSVQNQTENNLLTSFLTSEVRVYPNPVRNELIINILHASKGNDQIELLDEKGVKLKEKVVVYNGMGAIENWNLSGLKAGQYFLNIRHIHPVTGKLIKKGAYKILKIN